jgi:hypothetical protein
MQKIYTRYGNIYLSWQQRTDPRLYDCMITLIIAIVQDKKRELHYI